MPVCQLSALALLAGCGGGGGGVAPLPAPPVNAPPITPTPPPPPAPAPAPTPTPTPTLSIFDTPEYRRSAAAAVQAVAAYDRGASGVGITLAIIDSGVNPALAEFAGRISGLSRDVASNRALVDERGHGTSVAGAAVAARNGSGIHGVAPGATLLALRADTPGTCNDEGCSYTSTAIAAGFDAAVANRARVINVSLGGPGTSLELRAAATRAGNAGIVTVLSAGNEGLPSPEGFANQLAASAPTTTLVVGAVDSAGQIASFSNRAGALSANFLVAPGVSVLSFNQDGAAFLYSGTSIAAPVVSGAAALLAQAFPVLTGAQIVEILLRTTDDLGAPGVDAIFGQGRLNVQRAFEPVGGLTAAGSSLPITLGGSLGGPIGDGGALRGALAAVPVQDFYARDFTADLGQGLILAAPGRLAARLQVQPGNSAVVESGGASAAFWAAGDQRQSWAGDRKTMAAYSPAGGSSQPTPAGHMRLALASGQVMAFGHGQSAAGLLALADAAPGSAPDLITADLALPAGSQPLGAAALAQPLGDFTLAVAAGQALLPTARSPQSIAASDGSAARQSTALVRVSRRWHGLELAGLLRLDDERGSLAGTRLSSGFGLSGGSTISFGVAARLLIGGVELAGDWRRARSRLALGPGLITAAGPLHGDAGSLMLSRGDLLRAGDRFSIAVTRPLAMAGPLWLAGGIGVGAPVWLGPTKRETALEAAYLQRLPAGGAVQFALFHRDHPGHVAAARPDQGAAMRLTWGR